MNDKKIIIFGIGVVVILVIFYIAYFVKEQFEEGFSQTKKEKKENEYVQNFNNWVDYNSKLTHFTAKFPSLPETSAQAVSIAGADKNVKGALNIFVSQLSDQTLLMVKVLRFPKDFQVKDAQFQLKAAMNDILTAKKNNVLRNIRQTTWEGNEALDYSIMNNELRVDAKSIYANHAIYTLVYANSVGNFDTNVFDFFVNHFSLKKPANESKN